MIYNGLSCFRFTTVHGYLFYSYPQPAEFLKWNNSPSIFGTVQYHFYLDENLKMVKQQYRAWSDCMDVLAGLVLYLWQTWANHFQFQQDKEIWLLDEWIKKWTVLVQANSTNYINPCHPGIESDKPLSPV